MTLTNFSGLPVLSISEILGLTMPTAEPVWHPMTRALFADPTLVPSRDPDATLTNPLTLNDGTGDLGFELTQDAAHDTLRLLYTVFWPLLWPPGWLGNGEWALYYKVTVNGDGASRIGLSLGLCDQGCDPGAVGAVAYGAGPENWAAASWNTVITSIAGSIIGTVNVAFADTPTYIIKIIPGGRIGDFSNGAGVLQDGRYNIQMAPLGAGVPVWVRPTAVATVTGPVRPFLSAGFSTLGAANVQFGARVEWALGVNSPAGEFPA
jgi:hypothetical protein